jgi:hypothetical protein
MPEPAQLRGYPLLRLGVEGDGKKQRCHRGSEFRCAPAVAAFVGRLVPEVAPDHHAGLIIAQFDDRFWHF